MTSESPNSLSRFRPHLVGLVVLVAVAVLGIEMLVRPVDLPEDGRAPAASSPADRERGEPKRTDDPKQTRPPTTGGLAGDPQVDVVEVPDGDSLVVDYDGKRVRVRLQGIDCPERAQQFGSEARNFTRGLVGGKRVTLVKQGTDQYERVLGYVKLPDGRDLAETLVEAGMAWHYRRYSDSKTLDRLQQQAKAARRGLWAGKDPTPPWQWRRVNPR